LTSPPAKQIAFIKAMNHLHDVMMPDLTNFAREKKGARGKRMTNSVAGKGDINWEGRGSPGSDEEVDWKKKQRISGGKSEKSAQTASEDDSAVEAPPRKAVKKVHVVSHNKESDNSSSG
jgi:hypothetical protein